MSAGSCPRCRAAGAGTQPSPPAGATAILRGGRHRTRVIVRARAWRRGHGPGDGTRDAGRRGNPGVGQVRAGSDPRGAPRHRPGMVPSRCRLSRRGVSDVPVLRLPVSGLGRGARTPCPHLRNPHRRRGLPAVPRLVVGGSAGRSGSAQRRVGAGAFPHPAGHSAARSHARIRGTPRTGPSPGAMAAESHRRGRRPVPGPARSATGRAPEGRPGIAPGPPRTGAVRKHKIGTLSREAEPRAAVDAHLSVIASAAKRARAAQHRQGRAAGLLRSARKDVGAEDSSAAGTVTWAEPCRRSVAPPDRCTTHGCHRRHIGPECRAPADADPLAKLFSELEGRRSVTYERFESVLRGLCRRNVYRDRTYAVHGSIYCE